MRFEKRKKGPKKPCYIALVIALAFPVQAFCQTVEQDLIGLGMSPEQADYLASVIPAGAALDNNVYLKANNQAGSADVNLVKLDTSDNTIINSSASDDLILQLEDDANRLITFDAASDTALKMRFGDQAGAVGGTATQTFIISADTANTDDDSTIGLAGGGAIAAGRGGSIECFGNEVTSVGGGCRISGDDGGTAGNTVIAAWSGGTQNTLWTFVYDGRISQDATNGADIIFAKAGSQIKYPAAVVITPSTSFPTPNAGDTISNRYNIIAAGAPTATFVELPVATISVGRTHTVMNSSSNPVAIVPQGGNTQGVAAAATPYSCATLKKCNCTAFTTSNWQCDQG